MRTRTALIVTLATALICTALAQITLTTGQPNQWKIEIVDNEVDTASSTSIALDNNGNPHISYSSPWDGALKYARLAGMNWNIETVDTSYGVMGVSIALDTNGNPHISYCVPLPLDIENENAASFLKYALWTKDNWDIQIIENDNSVYVIASDSSIALDNKGYAHISYYWNHRSKVGYASWNGENWIKEILDNILDWRWGTFGWRGGTSMALDSDDNPHISYYNSALKYARWTASGWSIETVDSGGDVGSSTSIALDNNGNPHISYCSSNGELKYVFLSATPVSEFVWIILVAVITIGITVLVAWRKFLKKRGIVK